MKFATLITGVLVFVGGYYLATKPLAVRSALPLRAIVSMDEYYRDFAPLPDFIHCVKVEISNVEFQSFISDMKFVPYKGKNGFPNCDVEWWSASPDSSHAFFAPGNGKESSVMAKLENGKLFYVALAW